MKLLVAGLCLVLGTGQTQGADSRDFTNKIAVTAAPSVGLFHHLDGSGRKHIAVAGALVAVVWEDNRSGSPQVYASFKSAMQPGFADALAVSSGREAYEPAIDAVGDRRFVIGYEQDASVFVRILGVEGLSAAARLNQAPAGHVSVAGLGDRIIASWREHDRGRWYIKVAAIRIDADNHLVVESSQTIESEGLQTPVLFPALAVSAAGLCVAWEDRRAGHTRLLVSYSAGAGKLFSPPQSLNEFFSNRNQYDQGNGVTRVALSAFAEGEILAAWMDKRRGGLGYGIFAALGSEAGKIFGPNEKVHGAEGDRQPHYNPATAGNPAGDFVVAWDDFRRGDSDVWLSAYGDDLEWSEDQAPAVASGEGEQSHPSIALDADGNLHLLWIERAQLDAPSRLWYSLGRIHAP